jgi:ribosome-binding protein aMBF1 (putative translation factor)
MEHQDWKPVGWNKPKPKNAVDAKRRGYTTQVKTKSQFDAAKAKVDKTEIGDLKKVTKAQATAITNGRIAKGMNQKQLATIMNVKVDVVKQYEMGKAIVDHKIMNTFRRVLGIKM